MGKPVAQSPGCWISPTRPTVNTDSGLAYRAELGMRNHVKFDILAVSSVSVLILESDIVVEVGRVEHVVC